MTIRHFAHRLLPIALLAAFAACKPEPVEVEKPLYPTVGAINARFTVGDSVTVVFAQGNLQYQPTTRQWRFAINQYDVVGGGNSRAAASYDGWIDLFGYGTSGHDGLMPYTADDTSSHYVPGEADIDGTLYDWGVRNSIANGGGAAGQWRTLTNDEWRHLFHYRQRAAQLRGLATIEHVAPDGGDMHGLVLLPDKWERPQAVAFTRGSDSGFATNVYTVGDWNLMQSAGAVFLPAAGYRDSLQVSLVGDFGCYWTATSYTDQSAYELYFQSTGVAFYTNARAIGHSVRLVANK